VNRESCGPDGIGPITRARGLKTGEIDMLDVLLVLSTTALLALALLYTTACDHLNANRLPRNIQ
jgi:hypothetical protein